jgi:peptide/nickel transport system substrate-binding protein
MKFAYKTIVVIIFTINLLISAGIVNSFAETSQPVSGGKLVYAIPGNPDSLDPQATEGTLTFQHVKSVYDTLVEPNESGNLVPALAESWELSEEDKTLTFHLRKEVKFHI